MSFCKNNKINQGRVSLKQELFNLLPFLPYYFLTEIKNIIKHSTVAKSIHLSTPCLSIPIPYAFHKQ